MPKLIKLTFILSCLSLLIISSAIIILPSSANAIIEGITLEDTPVDTSSDELDFVMPEAPASDELDFVMPEPPPEDIGGSGSGGSKAFFSDSFQEYLPMFYLWALVVGGALSIAVLIWAGFDYATSAGDTERTNQAKDKIVGAVLGLLVLILASLILRALGASS